jgi:hypothetical protein
MKRSGKLSIVFLTLLCSISAYPTTWIVDNSVGSNIASFTSLQEANDTNIVTNGDTIQLIGSATSYGNITFTKELHVFGTGYRLDENGLNSPNGLYSTTGAVSFSNGSDGSSIEGIKTGNINIRDSSITILKCHIERIYISTENYENTNNIVIMGSYIMSIDIGTSNALYSNILISNCIIHLEWYQRSVTINGSGTSNNILITNNYLKYPASIVNTTFVNNIIDGGLSESGSIVHYNACDEEQLPTDGNNIQNVDFSAVFLGADSSSFDGQYQNRHDSPIAGMGQLGIDIGPFGGEYPYVLSGMPSLPAILQFDAIPVVTDELEFKIIMKSFR